MARSETLGTTSATATTALAEMPRERPRAAGPRGRLRRWLPWLVIPALMFAALEMATRRAMLHQSAWYDRQAAALRREPTAGPRLGFIFIGNSRVREAIDVDAFNATVVAALEKANGGSAAAPALVINFGMGHSTLAEHYLGVRNLIEAAPQRFRGCVVFVDAPEGMPHQAFWDRDLYLQEQPQILLPVLRASDLGRLWQGNGGVEDKCALTVRWLLSGSAAISHRERMHEELTARAATSIAKRLGMTAEPAAPAGAPAALSGEGGIKSDQRAMRAARAYATRVSAQEIATEAPLGDWDRSIEHDLVELVTRAGGRVVFFAVPSHSVAAAPSHTPLREADRRHFAEVAARWGTPVLKTDFVTTDEDFPDVWHLRLVKAKPFSEALARAYLAAVR